MVIITDRKKPKDCAHCFHHFDCDKYDSYSADTVEGYVAGGCPLQPADNYKPVIYARWISHKEHCEMNNLLPSGLGSYFWCSECDCGIDTKAFRLVNYNYCPVCGAKMDGEHKYGKD